MYDRGVVYRGCMITGWCTLQVYGHGVVYCGFVIQAWCTAGVWSRGCVLRVCDTGVVYRGYMITGWCTWVYGPGVVLVLGGGTAGVQSRHGVPRLYGHGGWGGV